MAKRARQKPTSIELTVRVDLHDHWKEREIREDILPPQTFAALADELATTILQRILPTDVQRITIGEPARRNFAHTFDPVRPVLTHRRASRKTA
jgi:hypothetical protein